MEEGYIIIIVSLVLVICLSPIYILMRIKGIKKDIDFLDARVDSVTDKLDGLIAKTPSKEDTNQILDAVQELARHVEKLQSGEYLAAPAATKPQEIPIVPAVEEVASSVSYEVSPLLAEQAVTENIEIHEAAIAEQSSISEAVPEIPLEVTPPPYIPPVQKTAMVAEKPAKKSLIETFFTENLLSKIGIITLVLGIGFFVKYAIDKDWINEIGRVGIGILTGGILIGIAHRLKKDYSVFSSILVGGGISVFYITITLAFREYEIFSQTVAFVILIAITIFSVLLSLLYDRKELAIFSLLGGFASPLMISTGSGNYIVLFSYIFILNTGMLILSFRKQWRAIGIISYLLTLIFFFSWMFSSFAAQYIGASLFAVVFYIQFYTLAILDHFKKRHKTTAYQALLILSNNLFVFLSLLYIFDGYMYDLRGIITIAIAVVNAVIMLALFRKSEIDRNLIYLVIAVVMTFVSLAIPIQLRGHAITMFWAAEMVVLLWLWQKSRIAVFRIGFLVISIAVLISYMMDVAKLDWYAVDFVMPIIANRVFITGVVLIVAVVITSLLLRKEDATNAIEIKGVHVCKVSSLVRWFKILIVLLTFAVPYIELNYQISQHIEKEYDTSFRYLAMATYTTVFVAILSLVFRKKATHQSVLYSLFLISVGLYTIGYSSLAIDFRYDTFFVGNQYPPSYFWIHVISVPAIALVMAYLVRKAKLQDAISYQLLAWILVILSVSILSVETDNMTILLLGNADHYYSQLYDVHTFGYPILWGIIAMILMIWGLKGKEVILRKISLFFFGGIIVKFYAYDVWYMSQAGRIVSFVILGVIFLFVSFLQQKIKTLVKEDKQHVDEQMQNPTE